jgi:hypothetical protein
MKEQTDGWPTLKSSQKLGSINYNYDITGYVSLLLLTRAKQLPR